MPVGQHLIFDCYVENTNLLRDSKFIEASFLSAFDAFGVSVIQFVSHTFSGQGGVTGVFLLSESHASFHTWPEHRLICCDFFTCGEIEMSDLLKHLASQIKSTKTWAHILPRGGDVNSNAGDLKRQQRFNSSVTGEIKNGN
jgi:S-adenosylmethionine decarboxylase